MARMDYDDSDDRRECGGGLGQDFPLQSIILTNYLKGSQMKQFNFWMK